MSKSTSSTLKPWYVLFVFLLIWGIVPVVSKSFSKELLYEFQAPFWVASSKISDLQSFWALKIHSRNSLIETCRDLARLNAAYELKLQENTYLKDEVLRLENALNIPPLPEYQTEVARVCRRDRSLWWQQIMIRKGKDYGIIPGAAVVYRGGVVGKIKEVFEHTSVVELVTSKRFRVAAHLEGDDRPVTYQGNLNMAFSGPKGQLFNIPEDVIVTAEKPRKLVSSMLGGVFPDGLFIGWLTELEPGSDGLFMQGTIELENALLNLSEVAVLLPLKQEN